MAERNRPHIFLGRTINPEPFTPTSSGRNGASPPTPSDPDAHSRRLRQSLSQAADQAAAERHPTLQVEGAISGIYVQFEAVPGFELALTSLEPQQGKVHPELRAVTEQDVNGQAIQFATVFVPDGWIGKFIERFEQYASDRTAKGNRKNADLVERIADLRLATLAALWTDPQAAFPVGDGPVWWELWLRRRDGVTERLDSFAEQSDVRVGARRLVLDDRVIVLVRATAEQLGAALGVLDDIAELRRPAEAFHVLADLDAADQAEFVADLAGRLEPPPSTAPRTWVLDTGVAGSHPLIAPALDPADLHTVDPTWTIEDRRGHGTMMAGTTLYPDLGATLLTNELVPLITRLESVKILPNDGDNEDHLYGAITAQAISIVEIDNPSSQRTFLLAVTAPQATRPRSASQQHGPPPSTRSPPVVRSSTTTACGCRVFIAAGQGSIASDAQSVREVDPAPPHGTARAQRGCSSPRLDPPRRLGTARERSCAG